MKKLLFLLVCLLLVLSSGSVLANEQEHREVGVCYEIGSLINCDSLNILGLIDTDLFADEIANSMQIIGTRSNTTYHFPTIGTRNYLNYFNTTLWMGGLTDVHLTSIHRITKTSDQRATLHTTQLRGYNNDQNLVYGVGYIYDSFSNHRISVWDFFRLPVSNRIWTTTNNWTYSNFSASNNCFLVDQHLMKGTSGGLLRTAYGINGYRHFQKQLDDREDNQIIVAESIDEASSLASFGVKTLNETMPPALRGIEPITYISFSPFDKNSAITEQIWLAKDNLFLVLVQSPSLSGMAGGKPAIINGLGDTVEVLTVERKNMPSLYVVAWEHNGMGYNLGGTLTQGLKKKDINDMARSLRSEY